MLGEWYFGTVQDVLPYPRCLNDLVELSSKISFCMLQKYYYLLLFIVIICYCVLCTMCLKPKTFVDTLERTESSEQYDVDYDSCDNVDPEESIAVGAGDLVVIQLNIRGLSSRTGKLKTLLNDCTTGKKSRYV